MDNREQGRRYEVFAAKYLCSRGYQIIAQNFRCRQGEVDVIAKDGRDLAFVEVKYRKNLEAGFPAEAVDRKKQQKIRQAARYYLYRNHYGEEVPCRFDMVSIVGEKISLIQDAF